ncbi:DNA circularization protein [Enterobacter ludwigii]|uniref:DNA circularization protein n=1 Tax=Enterobacter ludwigii TaxID=299767 RepID=UPI0013D2E1DA|nr:DNA circularization N-terminal domain-containing protein [Enterobacter ludwigii]
MSWKDDLLDASFRGVTFDCVDISDTLARDVAQYRYPYREGADVEDLGGKPDNIRMTAIFFGEDYETRLQKFIQVLNTPGYGELIHPVFGSYPKVQLLSCVLSHKAEDVDCARLTLTFLEAASDQQFFSRQYPTQQADAIDLNTDSLLDEALSAWNKMMASLQQLQYTMERYRNLANTAEFMIQSLSAQINGITMSGLDYLDEPGKFVSDLKGLMANFSDGLSFTGNRLTSDWRSLTSISTAVVAMPAQRARQGVVDPNSNDGNTITVPAMATTSVMPDEDLQQITETSRLTVITEMGSMAGIILGDELQTPTLTTDQVSDILSDVRGFINDAIDAERSREDLMQKDGLIGKTTADTRDNAVIVETLKTLALQLQELARAVILAAPPLVCRVVPGNCNLHLLAHSWYGDYTRADELLRLNPDLESPNKIAGGTILNAYAK